MKEETKYVMVSRKLLPLLNRQLQVKITDGQYLVDPRLGVIHQTDRDLWLGVPPNGFNYFCFNKQNKITYWETKRGEQPLTEDGRWKKEGRQEMKPGRFFLYFADYFRVYEADSGFVLASDNPIREKVIARGAELFVARIQGENTDMEFEISDTPSEVYKSYNRRDSYNLDNSCMRQGSGHSCRHYSAMYDTIPGLKIVYKKDADNYLLLRALLWRTQDYYSGEEVTFLDRVYGTDGHSEQLMDFAREQGWAYRSFSNNRIHYKGKCDALLKVPVSDATLEYIESIGTPYMDTVSYLHRSVDGQYFLCNDCSENKEDMKENDDQYLGELQCPSGNTITVRQRCHSCNKKECTEEQFIYRHASWFCPACIKKLTKKCAICGNKDLHPWMNTLYNHDGRRTEHVCQHCANKRVKVKFCNDCNCFYRTEDMEYKGVQGDWFCHECIAHWKPCKVCKELKRPQELRTRIIDGVRHVCVCATCYEEHTKDCEICRDRFSDILKFDQYTLMGNRRKMKFVCSECQRAEREYYRRNRNEQPWVHPPMVDTPVVVRQDMRNQLQLPLEMSVTELSGEIICDTTEADTPVPYYHDVIIGRRRVRAVVQMPTISAQEYLTASEFFARWVDDTPTQD